MIHFKVYGQTIGSSIIISFALISSVESQIRFFPTKFKTEGIPGTIIDALSAGVPIVASRWDNVDEIIIDGINGLIYEFNNLADFYAKLKTMLNCQKVFIIKKNCVKCAKNFDSNVAIEPLTNALIG